MSEQGSITNLAGTIEGASYCLGIVTGIEMVARLLRKKSGDAWERDQDEKAEIYRDVSREFEKLAKGKDDTYRQEKRGGKDAAWRQLADIELELAQHQDTG